MRPDPCGKANLPAHCYQLSTRSPPFPQLGSLLRRVDSGESPVVLRLVGDASSSWCVPGCRALPAQRSDVSERPTAGENSPKVQCGEAVPSVWSLDGPSRLRHCSLRRTVSHRRMGLPAPRRRETGLAAARGAGMFRPTNDGRPGELPRRHARAPGRFHPCSKPRRRLRFPGRGS